ncbi:MAG: C40 family peptidase, partial [Actinomycetes bacterium]
AAAAATSSLLRAGAALSVASPDASDALRQLQTDLAALAALVGPTTIDPATAPLVAATPNATPVDGLVAAWTSLPPGRLAVLLFALEQVGKPYVWAAAGPDAYDCSGLMLRAFALAGVALAHFSGTQVRSGPPVTPEQIAPTDLLGFGESSTNHVEMYLGGGRTVEAKGRAWGVVVSDVDLTSASNIAHIL